MMIMTIHPALNNCLFDFSLFTANFLMKGVSDVNTRIGREEKHYNDKRQLSSHAHFSHIFLLLAVGRH